MAAPKSLVLKPNFLTAALLSLSACAALASGSSVSAATIFVDDDQQGNASPTIQAALLKAKAGDTIRVRPGVYYGPVVVDKAVTIQGAGPTDFATNPPAPGVNDPSVSSIVYNTGQGGFDVVAGDVSISRFRIVGSTQSPAYPNAGIVLRAGSGRTLNSNVFEGNGLGVYAEGNEQSLTISGNAFYNNFRSVIASDPYNQTYPHGGMFLTGGQLNTATIQSNRFSGNGQFSMNFGNVSSVGLAVTQNTANNEGAFVIVGNTTNAQISGNTATNLYSTGVYSFGNNTGLSISQNTLQGAGVTLGNGAGIRLTVNYGNTVGDTNPSITSNTISGFPFDGLRLQSISGAVVSANTISGNGRHGIFVQTTSTSQFTQNVISSNAQVGIQVEATSTNNLFGGSPSAGNTLTGNVVLDAGDASVGGGTAGTANTWIGNTGGTSNPIGILNNAAAARTGGK
ncbi:MAG: right-handed parallel beta-helix repeat-containing protein [Armatimonadota bacterium]